MDLEADVSLTPYERDGLRTQIVYRPLNGYGDPYLRFWVPCLRDVMEVPIGTGPKQWKFSTHANGKPSLFPSVRHTRYVTHLNRMVMIHFHLTDGDLAFCGDSERCPNQRMPLRPIPPEHILTWTVLQSDERRSVWIDGITVQTEAE